MEYKWLYKIKYSDRNHYEDVYNRRINGESAIKYNINISDYPLFVVLTPQLHEIIYSIQKNNTQLVKILSKIPNIAISMYNRNCLIEEIKQTNELEGVVSTRREIADILENKSVNSRLNGIVNKYAMLSKSDSIKLNNCSDIRALYNDLVLEEVKQSDSSNIPDGELFRKEEVFIKDANTNSIIHKGVMPEAKIIESLSNMMNLINNSSYNQLIIIAVIHYVFGYIHPFYDGNGRMSRFISSYLISKELEPIVSYRLAYAIKKNTAEYYKMFKLTNKQENRGELTGFVLYFMELIDNTIKELIEALSDYYARLNSHKKQLDALTLQNTEKEIAFVLLQNKLFAVEGLTIDKLSDITKKSVSTVRKTIKTLNDKSLVEINSKKPYEYSLCIDNLHETKSV